MYVYIFLYNDWIRNETFQQAMQNKTSFKIKNVKSLF